MGRSTKGDARPAAVIRRAGAVVRLVLSNTSLSAAAEQAAALLLELARQTMAASAGPLRVNRQGPAKSAGPLDVGKVGLEVAAPHPRAAPEFERPQRPTGHLGVAPGPLHLQEPEPRCARSVWCGA